MTTSQPRLEVRNVTKTWRAQAKASPLPVLQDVSLAVGAGEFVALVGPSGCGKSTLLNVIAGLQHPDSGEVRIDGEPVAGPGRVAYMHQRDLLLPWRDVRSNARLGPELAGVGLAESDRRVGELAGRFGIGDVLSTYPAHLSGGMRQRVALLRAVLPDRNVLLLDEPFGALDAITRAGLQQWLGEVLDRSDKAVVLVTHDVEEALLLSDSVCVMQGPPGRIVGRIRVQLSRPRSVDWVTTPTFVALKREVLAMLAPSWTTL